MSLDTGNTEVRLWIWTRKRRPPGPDPHRPRGPFPRPSLGPGRGGPDPRLQGRRRQGPGHARIARRRHPRPQLPRRRGSAPILDGRPSRRTARPELQRPAGQPANHPPHQPRWIAPSQDVRPGAHGPLRGPSRRRPARRALIGLLNRGRAVNLVPTPIRGIDEPVPD
jgi:hypothetical protein